MSGTDGSLESEFSDSEPSSDASYDSCVEGDPTPRLAKQLPGLRLTNSGGDVPATPRDSNVALNRLSLGSSRAPPVPMLGLRRFENSAADSLVLPSARVYISEHRPPSQAPRHSAGGPPKLPNLGLPTRLKAPLESADPPVDSADDESRLAAVLHLDLLAEGLRLTAAQIASSGLAAKPGSRRKLEPLKTELAGSFGVGANDVRLYKLVEVAEDALLDPSCARYALGIPGAGFSVTAVERAMESSSRLLQDNNRLKGVAEQDGRSLASLKEQIRLQGELIAQQEEQLQQRAQACRALAKDNEALKEEAKALRGQLERHARQQLSPAVKGRQQPQPQPSGLKQWVSLFGEGRKDPKGEGSAELEQENHSLKSELRELRSKLATSWHVMEEARGVLGELRQEVDQLGGAPLAALEDGPRRISDEGHLSLAHPGPGFPSQQRDVRSKPRASFLNCITRLCQEENVTNLQELFTVLNGLDPWHELRP